MGSPVTLLDHGFFRARAVSPVLSLAQPRDNARALTAAARAAAEAEATSRASGSEIRRERRCFSDCSENAEPAWLA